MKKQLLYTVLALLAAHLAAAQVLWSENFDNLTVGDLSTDSTGATSGQNGWYVHKNFGNPDVVVTPEAGRGNVLAIGNDTKGQAAGIFQKDINNLWNNRTSGNNILMLEYDYYLADIFPTSFNTSVSLREANIPTPLFDIYTNSYDVPAQERSATTNGLVLFVRQSSPMHFGLGKNGTRTYENFPYESWISVKFFIDYTYAANTITGGTVYIYISSLGILKSVSFSGSEVVDILSFGIGTSSITQSVIVTKFDNIKLTALQSLPSYLGIDDFISSKFNLYPNPANDIVTITNSENIGIEEITVYDINGKTVKSQKGKSENEVSLNLSNLSSGTYLLHIKTKQGTAVKKVIKK